MFREIVGNQYIGKSKLDIHKGIFMIDPTTVIGSICKKVPDSIMVTYKNAPDYYLPCNLVDISTIEAVDKYDSFNYILMITGIPKRVPLNTFKFRQIAWSSYYEDSYRGYLFQLIGLDIFKKYFDRERFGGLYRELLIY